MKLIRLTLASLLCMFTVSSNALPDRSPAALQPIDVETPIPLILQKGGIVVASMCGLSGIASGGLATVLHAISWLPQCSGACETMALVPSKALGVSSLFLLYCAYKSWRRALEIGQHPHMQ